MNYLVDKIGDVGVHIGKRVASSLSDRSSGSRVVSSTTTVISGGITGTIVISPNTTLKITHTRLAASTVWISLEDATKTLLRSIASETTQIVQLQFESNLFI